MTTPASEGVVRIRCLAVVTLPHDGLENGRGSIEAVVLASLLSLAGVTLDERSLVVSASHLRESCAGLK